MSQYGPVWEGFLPAKRWSRPELEQVELGFVVLLHLFVGKTTTLPSHKLQDEATPLPKHLVGLQQEPPRELELEPCQQALHEYACHQTVKKVGSA